MLKSLAVFVSGSGSNLQSLIDATNTGYIDNAQVKLVIASKCEIYAIERAKKANIEYLVFDKNNYDRLDNMFDEIITVLSEKNIDYIVLAGYLTILPQNIIKEYGGRIINIHPSLIPNFCGDGYYGMRVHRAVIEQKVKKTGATVHFVDEGVDTGEIILQEEIDVLENDTPESLQKRVLALEHTLLPKAIKFLTKE